MKSKNLLPTASEQLFIRTIINLTKVGFKELRKRGLMYCTKGDEYKFWASSYEYIEAFILFLRLHKIKENARIVDIGCGISPVLLSLHALSYTNLIGIENEQDLVSSLIALTGEIEVLWGDVFSDESMEVISEADVIYMYMPFLEPKYKTFINKVARVMKKGAFIIDFYGPLERDLPYKRRDFLEIVLSTTDFASSNYLWWLDKKVSRNETIRTWTLHRKIFQKIN